MVMICPRCKGACRINGRRYAEKPLSPDSVEIAKECLCRGTGAIDVEALAKDGMMICPACDGTCDGGPAFVDGTDPRTGRRFGRLETTTPCRACRGAGTVDVGYPKRAADGRAFREKRVAAGLSLRDIAKKLNVSVVEVSEYERGAASKDVAARLQRALGD